MRSETKSSRTTKAAQFAVAAIATVPVLTGANTALAQKGEKGDAAPTQKKAFVLPHVLEKSGTIASMEGIEDGHVIYKNDADRYFYLDPKTGDQKFLSSHHTIKLTNASIKARTNWEKIRGNIKLLGIDENGNTVQQNEKGDKFYLDPETGDMVFVK